MGTPLWVLATAYRIIYGIAGGYVTARLAPDRLVRHAVILGVIGLVMSIAGAAATLGKGPEVWTDVVSTWFGSNRTSMRLAGWQTLFEQAGVAGAGGVKKGL